MRLALLLPLTLLPSLPGNAGAMEEDVPLEAELRALDATAEDEGRWAFGALLVGGEAAGRRALETWGAARSGEEALYSGEGAVLDTISRLQAQLQELKRIDAALEPAWSKSSVAVNGRAQCDASLEWGQANA